MLPELVKAVSDLDWTLPTDIQAESIPLILGGGDVLMAAETGSGKTGAFCLPVLQIVYETLREKSVSGGKAAAAVRPQAKMSVSDRDPLFAIAPDGLLCQARDEGGWQGARANLGAVRGKHYFEAEVTDEGLCRVGWSTASAALELGVDKNGFGFGGTGRKSFAKQFDPYGEPFGLHDIIGCSLDLDERTVAWSKNGKHLGVAFTIPDTLSHCAFYPATTLKNAELKFNFGDQPFRFPPPAPIKGLAQQPDENIQVSGGSAAAKPRQGGTPLALIIEPSLELAQQTAAQIDLFKKYLPAPGVRSAVLIGGEAAKDQVRVLQQGVDVVVGTPGRLDDLVSSGKLDLSAVRFFVLDEVDGLLSQGHRGMIEKFYGILPKEIGGRRLQLIVCSATLRSREVEALAEKIMYHPTWVDLKGQDSVPSTVHQVVCMVDPLRDSWWQTPPYSTPTDGVHARESLKGRSQEALSQAVKVLKYKYLLAAIEHFKMDQALIFCRTRIECDNLERFLNERGGGARSMTNALSCVCVHSDRSVQERRDNLQAFKDGEARFLICTDVAARGIDIRGLPYVINMTLPPSEEKENYVHRIGRVGRADRMGLAISLVATVREKVWYHKCANRGRGCENTNLVDKGGCCIWYDETQYLSDIERHLGETVGVVDESFNVPVSEYDGVVTYGEKRGTNTGFAFESHAALLAPSVMHLAELEHTAQSMFLTSHKWKSGK